VQTDAISACSPCSSPCPSPLSSIHRLPRPPPARAVPGTASSSASAAPALAPPPPAPSERAVLRPRAPCSAAALAPFMVGCVARISDRMDFKDSTVASVSGWALPRTRRRAASAAWSISLPPRASLGSRATVPDCSYSSACPDAPRRVSASSTSRSIRSASACFPWFKSDAARLLALLSVSGCSSPSIRLLAPSTSRSIRSASACFPWSESGCG
jgi:hypothetical protein